jgi:2-amino-4-hydroxy-6-hydroxymethyldihydropteridine diphosphokinase
MKNTAYLSVGTNLGNRELNLKIALKELKQTTKIELVRSSQIYETEPVGGVKQDDFLNIAVEIKTDFSPQELLERIHQIEQGLHRERLVHWGPRTIDLDILYFNEQTISTESLKVPHPEIKNRRFVLVPMLEITSDNQELHQKLLTVLEQTKDQNSVKIFKSGSEINE